MLAELAQTEDLTSVITQERLDSFGGHLRRGLTVPDAISYIESKNSQGIGDAAVVMRDKMQVVVSFKRKGRKGLPGFTKAKK